MSNSNGSSEKILASVYDAIDEVNATRTPDRQVQKSPQTALFGRDAHLDSLGLVGLVVSVEQHVADKFGANITLADEKAMSQRNSPFRTVQTLVDYIAGLLAESPNV